MEFVARKEKLKFRMFLVVVVVVLIQEFLNNDEQLEKPSKDEYTIAKWLKKNVPHKKTKFLYHNVEYFTGVKAVDALMTSHFVVPKEEGSETLFKSRADVVDFLDM